jgi:hypothetical protein
MSARRTLNKAAAWTMLSFMIVLPSCSYWKQERDARALERSFREIAKDPKAIERMVEAFRVPDDTLPPLPAALLSEDGAPELCNVSDRFEGGYVVDTLSFVQLLVVHDVVVANGEVALCGFTVPTGKLRWKLGGSADQEYLGTDGTSVFATWDGSPTFAVIDPVLGLVTDRIDTLPANLRSPDYPTQVSAAGMTLRLVNNAVSSVSTAQFISPCVEIELTVLGELQIAARENWIFVADSQAGVFLGLHASKANAVAKVLRSAFSPEDVVETKRC